MQQPWSSMWATQCPMLLPAVPPQVRMMASQPLLLLLPQLILTVQQLQTPQIPQPQIVVLVLPPMASSALARGGDDRLRGRWRQLHQCLSVGNPINNAIGSSAASGGATAAAAAATAATP